MGVCALGGEDISGKKIDPKLQEQLSKPHGGSSTWRAILYLGVGWITRTTLH